MKKKKIEQEKYLEFISSLTLKGIKLDFMKAEVKRELIKEKSELLGEWFDDIKVIEIKKNLFSILHELKFVGYIETKKFVEVKIGYRLDYEVKKKVKFDEEFIEIFKVNGVPLHSWPYMRELLASTLMRMGLPPFFLPLAIVPGIEK